MQDPLELYAETGWLPPFVRFQALDPNECARIIALSQEEGMEPGVQVKPNEGTFINDSYRRCDVHYAVNGSEVYQSIMDVLRPMVDTLNTKHYQFDLFEDLLQMVPRLNINRYEDKRDGGIGMHMDLGSVKTAWDRKLSVTIALNDYTEYGGGELLLRNGDSHYPLNEARAGEAVIFPSFMMHAVQNVTWGTRYSAVVWCRGPKFR